ncbi:MAG: LysE family transporter, partial [Deltaproteobacteria bacterium]|nr:LysE family transporter [Deltaproteobacteria bacterium]
MNLELLVKGMLIGLGIAAPVGPVGLLCLHRILTKGPGSGLASGLGVAGADALYASLAAFGVSVVTGLLVGHRFWLRLGGGLFLCGLGLKIFLTRQAGRRDNQAGDRSLVKDFFSAFFVTLSNPMTILAFSAIFAGLGLIRDQAGLMVLGVFLGSFLWWALLSGAGWIFRERVDLTAKKWFNRLSGA